MKMQTFLIIIYYYVITYPFSNAFNDFFSNIGRNLAASIPSGNASTMTFMPPAQEECIYLSPTTSEEIEEEIGKLNSTKATHPFSIPTKILKMIKGITCPRVLSQIASN